MTSRVARPRTTSVSGANANRLLPEITFGDELGGLLWREAEREESFPNVNMPDAMKMSPLDSNNILEVASLREARRNDREIRSNIPKLIRILSKQKDRRDKLEKEFAQQIKNSEIKNFTFQFEELKKLWNIHLTTSKEEMESVKRQQQALT